MCMITSVPGLYLSHSVTVYPSVPVLSHLTPFSSPYFFVITVTLSETMKAE